MTAQPFSPEVPAVDWQRVRKFIGWGALAAALIAGGAVLMPFDGVIEGLRAVGIGMVVAGAGAGGMAVWQGVKQAFDSRNA